MASSGRLVGVGVDDRRVRHRRHATWRRRYPRPGSGYRLSHPLRRVRWCDARSTRGLATVDTRRAAQASDVHVRLRRVPAGEPRRQRLLRPVPGPHPQRRRHASSRPAWSTRSTSATPARWTACGPRRWRWSSPRRRTSPARPTRPSSARATSRPPTSSTSRCSRTCSPSASRSSRPGGRIAVNVANLGRKPYRSLSADVIGILQDRLGLLLRGEVIWRKARGAGANCAWGSFKTAGQPGAARPHRAGGDRQQGPLRPRAARARSGVTEGLPVGGHHHRRRVHGRHPRRVGAGPGERHPRRPPGAVPGRAAAAPDRPLHLRGRRRARPVHGLGHHRRRRGARRSALPRLRHRRGLREGGPRAGRRRGRPRAGQPRSARPDKAVAAAGDALAAAGFTLADPKATKRRRFAGGVSVDWIATDAAGDEWLVHRGRGQHRDAHRAPALRCPLPHARRGRRAHHRRPPRARAHHRPPGPRLGGARGRARPRVASRWSTRSSWAPRASPARLAAYAAGGQHDPVGELLPGL